MQDFEYWEETIKLWEKMRSHCFSQAMEQVCDDAIKNAENAIKEFQLGAIAPNSKPS